MPTWSIVALILLTFCLLAFGVRAVHVSRQTAPAPAMVETFSPHPAYPPPTRKMQYVQNGQPPPTPVEPVPPPQIQLPPPAPPVTTPKAKPDGKVYWTVLGRGASVDDANLEALEEARTKVLVYLRNLNPPVEWTPTRDYIQEKLVKQREDSTKVFDAPVGLMHEVRLRVEVSPKDRAELLREDRHFRTEQRQLLLVQVLGGLLALLMAVAGYVRLDEWSKGYYTGWLRLATASLIGAAGAGWWLLLNHG
jgi:hypothetical protein